MHALATVIVAFLATVAGTRGLIGWLSARRLVASENDRTMHAGQIPQGGGLAVSAVIIAVTGLLWPLSSPVGVTLVGAGGLAVLSWFNDQHEIAPRIRLTAHVVAALAVMTTVQGNQLLLGGWLPLPLERCIVLLGLVWFINLYNFMDGIDGITGVETITLAVGALAVLTVGQAPTSMDGLALAMIGACAGFLVWNWHQARIFLGDVGSIPLGLLAGALLLYVAANVSVIAAVILPLYYLTDATWTLFRRWKRGEKLLTAHRQHAYQRAARACGSHAVIVVRIAACNAVLVAAALLALVSPIAGLCVAGLAICTLMWHLESSASALAPEHQAARVSDGDASRGCEPKRGR